MAVYIRGVPTYTIQTCISFIWFLSLNIRQSVYYDILVLLPRIVTVDANRLLHHKIQKSVKNSNRLYVLPTYLQCIHTHNIQYNWAIQNDSYWQVAQVAPKVPELKHSVIVLLLGISRINVPPSVIGTKRSNKLNCDRGRVEVNMNIYVKNVNWIIDSMLFVM